MPKIKVNRTFLVRQDELEGGKKKDVIAKRGEKFDFTDREAVKYWGCLNFEGDEKLQKRLLATAKAQNIKRYV